MCVCECGAFVPHVEEIPDPNHWHNGGFKSVTSGAFPNGKKVVVDQSTVPAMLKVVLKFLGPV